MAGNEAESGGAMSIYVPRVVILASTFSGNTATMGQGGALYLYSSESILIANSTFTGNSAAGDGGAINMYGLAETASVIQTTISGNTAGGIGDGIYLGGYDEVPADVEARARGNDDEPRATGNGERFFGTTLLNGTIVAGNGDGTDDIGTENDLAVVSSDHSVIGGTSTGIVVDDLGGTQLGITAPGLAALADNGGPTQTMALLPGSVALDAGPDPVADFPGNADDQRGPGYPRVVNGRVDVGAFEVQPVVIEPTFTG
jgi:predicted outer membrane repeat protein